MALNSALKKAARTRYVTLSNQEFCPGNQPGFVCREG